MNSVVARTFASRFDRGEGLVVSGLSFDSCMFESCAFSLTKDIRRRSTARDCELINCTANYCDIGPAILEDIHIRHLRTNDLLIVWGALFKHVKMSGNIGKLKLNQVVHHVDRTAAVQGPFDEFRETYYQSVDWSLDIRDARFKEFDVRGIPAAKFIRDPESQVVVTRARAMRSGWRERLSKTNTLWPFMIRLFLSDGDKDTVLVVPLGAPKPKRDNLLAGLRELRELGVAEPD